MNIKEISELGLKKLNNCEDALLKVRLILMNILNISREYIIINFEKEFPKEKEKDFFECIERVSKGEPIQYVINNQEFFGLNFYVDKNVLIPQPDTEILVEEVIKICNEKNFTTILDLCTGSGAIAIALEKNIKNAKVYASDISSKALDIAINNAKNNNSNIKFIKSNLFENIDFKFDIIVSNPPYIESNEIKNLSLEVQNEPLVALDGGKDGLEFYKKIASNAKKNINSNGYLALEIGFNQKNDVIKILEENGFKNIYSKKDLGNNDRIVIAN